MLANDSPGVAAIRFPKGSIATACYTSRRSFGPVLHRSELLIYLGEVAIRQGEHLGARSVKVCRQPEDGGLLPRFPRRGGPSAAEVLPWHVLRVDHVFVLRGSPR